MNEQRFWDFPTLGELDATQRAAFYDEIADDIKGDDLFGFGDSKYFENPTLRVGVLRPDRTVVSAGQTNAPTIGNTKFTIQVDKVLGGATGLLLIAGKPALLPLFGGTLLVDPTIHFVFPIAANGSVGVPGAGSVTLPAPLPNDKNLIGASGYLQAGFADKGAPQGVSLTHGLFLRAIQ